MAKEIYLKVNADDTHTWRDIIENFSGYITAKKEHLDPNSETIQILQNILGISGFVRDQITSISIQKKNIDEANKIKSNLIADILKVLKDNEDPNDLPGELQTALNNYDIISQPKADDEDLPF